MSRRRLPTAVVVHGGFADASGFSGVIRELGSTGYTVLAPPNPLRSLAFDAAAITSYVASIDGPVLLVGHSYGGAVITEASVTLGNVIGLVYLEAFGLDVGESCISVQQPFAPSLLSNASYPTAYDAAGAPHGPDLYVGREKFRETFCADVPVDTAEVMFATQRPLSTGSTHGARDRGRVEDHSVLVSRVRARQRHFTRLRAVHGRTDGRHYQIYLRVPRRIHRSTCRRGELHRRSPRCRLTNCRRSLSRQD